MRRYTFLLFTKRWGLLTRYPRKDGTEGPTEVVSSVELVY